MIEDVIACLGGSFIIVVIIIGNIFLYTTGKRDGAMEVYRGNTTLEYTIVDSVVVDSCVVFK